MLQLITQRGIVVIVEDEHLFRDLLRVALSHDPDLNVAGLFPDGESALQAIPQLHPDVAILDINLGEWYSVRAPSASATARSWDCPPLEPCRSRLHDGTFVPVYDGLVVPTEEVDWRRDDLNASDSWLGA